MFQIDWNEIFKNFTVNSDEVDSFINKVQELDLKNQTLQLKVDTLLEELTIKNELIKFLKEYISDLVKENNMLKEENNYYKSLLFSIGEQIQELKRLFE